MQLIGKSTRLICWTESDCALAVRRLKQSILIANDIETIPFLKKRAHHPFVMTVNGYSGLMANGTIESFCFPLQNQKSAASGAPTYIDSIYYAMREINDSGIPFTGQNYTYDLMWHLRYLMPVANWAYDSMIMWWAKYPELPKRLDFIASILLDDYQYWKAGRKSDDFIAYCDYCMSDCEYTLRITMILIEWMIEDPKMRMNWFYAHTRCLSGLAMSAKGMKINPHAIEKMGKDLTAEKDKAWNRARYVLADTEFNPNSPKQKSDVIYGLLGAKKRNARGRYTAKESDASVGAYALRAIRADHPLFRRVANVILEAIEPAKQLSNVVGLAFHNQRFLTSYDGVGTTTTRFSSRKSALGHGGNGQNIRKDYRIFLEADSDSFLLDIDFSGSDDYYIGFESQEPKKIELLRSGKDIHSFNASTIFFTNWTYESLVDGKKAGDKRVVHPITGIRQITKKLCHGMSFLMAGATLLMTAGREAIVAAAIEVGHADAGFWNQAKLVDFCAFLEFKFRDYYPRLKRHGTDSWYNDLRAEAIRTGGFTTIFNYFQRFLGDPYDDAILRALAATAGQANTAGRINMVLDELYYGMRMRRFRDGEAPDADDATRTITEASHGISLRLQTHDSLTFNIRRTNPGWRQGVEDIFHVMRRPVLCKGQVFSVGLEAECSFRWAGKEGRVVQGVEGIDTFLLEVPRPIDGNLLLAHT